MHFPSVEKMTLVLALMILEHDWIMTHTHGEKFSCPSLSIFNCNTMEGSQYIKGATFVIFLQFNNVIIWCWKLQFLLNCNTTMWNKKSMVILTNKNFLLFL